MKNRGDCMRSSRSLRVVTSASPGPTLEPGAGNGRRPAQLAERPAIDHVDTPLAGLTLLEYCVKSDNPENSPPRSRYNACGPPGHAISSATGVPPRPSGGRDAQGRPDLRDEA